MGEEVPTKCSNN